MGRRRRQGLVGLSTKHLGRELIWGTLKGALTLKSPMGGSTYCPVCGNEIGRTSVYFHRSQNIKYQVEHHWYYNKPELTVLVCSSDHSNIIHKDGGVTTMRKIARATDGFNSWRDVAVADILSYWARNGVLTDYSFYELPTAHPYSALWAAMGLPFEYRPGDLIYSKIIDAGIELESLDSDGVRISGQRGLGDFI